MGTPVSPAHARGTRSRRRIGGRRPRPGALAALLVAAALAGCHSPDGWAERADDEVDGIVGAGQTRVLGERENWIRQPEVLPEEAPVEEAPEPGDPDSRGAIDPGADVDGSVADGTAAPADAETPEGVADAQAITAAGAVAGRQLLVYDLEQSLEAAFSSSREYITRRESVDLQGLSLSTTRFAFGPQLSAALSTVYRDGTGQSSTTDSAALFGASQILPTGGVLSFDSSLTNARDGWTGRSDGYTASTTLSLNQPLMRGSGYVVTHEALTQAERNMAYELRDFELFRQDHAINIAGDFFDLVSERTQLANQQRRYEEALFDREKAEALRQLDRNQQEDVFLARRNEINNESALLTAQADYARNVDTFRIRLGLAEDVQLVIADEEPPFEPVRLDPDSAVNVALHNRLDLVTAREQLQDTERQVFITRDLLRPDVDLDMSYGRDGVNNRKTDNDPGIERGGQLQDDWNSRVGLSVEIPIQRTPERNTYRASRIALDRAQRNYDILLENVDRDVRDALRQLTRTEQQIELQVAQIEQERRAVAVTEIRYENGDVENRVLLEARQGLVDSENALIDLKVNHFISRMRLFRDLGILFVEPDGGFRS